ncbi:MAG: potassium-transporting ATPase subunit KdpA [Planctomycetes bacterium]|nr:potassium-transporting ATPase subunit KdpA [Planctomycetota bacterium]MBI3833131.1 potassium-transporting ATPase subunit KdpA [Planctomycetota bacterium]
MSLAELGQILLYLAVLILCAKPLGSYMAAVYEGATPRAVRWLQPVERLLYRLAGIRSDEEMNWKRYALAMLYFHLVGFVFLYGLQRVQAHLPLNPTDMPAVSPDSSFNTSVSFVTNTNWQGYGGETTMSYFTQMAGLTVQNFVSAAGGMAILVALIRGFVRRQTTAIGNYWVDLTRSTLYILLPLSVILALVLVSQGVVQTLKPYAKATLLQPTSYEQPKVDATGNPIKDANCQSVTEKLTLNEQTIAVGPAASQIAIKQLGTNGGGFFNANSSHPFENPTPLSNFLQMLSILLIPADLCYTFGVMIKDTRQGWALLAAMYIVLLAGLALCLYSEYHRQSKLVDVGVPIAGQVDGNMEGKEVRFGTANSALWAVTTTAASNGSVNSMHDSYMPLGGLVPMVMMQLGEVIFGGVGSGLYGMLVFVLVTVFIAGLMVGRTPEYLGKKIEAFEMKMSSIAVLAPCICVLVGTAIAVMTVQVNASMSNPLPHGFSQVLYAFSSASNNNGSAFGGFGGNNVTMNLLLGLVMLMGRFWVKIPVLALAGSLAAKKYVPVSAGTLPTHTPLFVGLVISIVLIVGALTFVPALALGPIAEHVGLFAAAR